MSGLFLLFIDVFELTFLFCGDIIELIVQAINQIQEGFFMIQAKIVSSLEKVFVDQRVDDFAALGKISALKGERVSIQIVHGYDLTNSPLLYQPIRIKPKVEGELEQYMTMRRVFNVPVTKTVHSCGYDDNYLRTEPGLYPDILKPLYYDGSFSFVMGALHSVWVEFDLPEDVAAGNYTMTFSFDSGNTGSASCSVEIEVIDAKLPKEDIFFTQWFHADCLANYYNVEVWS